MRQITSDPYAVLGVPRNASQEQVRRAYHTTYLQPAARSYDDNGPGWRTVLGTVAVGLLLFVVLFSGLLPAPLFGIVLLVAARSISGRFDR